MDLHAPLHWPAIMVHGYENVFKSVCDKRLHATHLLKCVTKLIDETKAPCFRLSSHTKMDKLLSRFNLMFTIFKRFMDIGNKGNYTKRICNDLFSINILKYRHYQLMWAILDIIGICQVLIKWVEKCIKHKKLDTLIQITFRVSHVLQSPNHRKYFQNN